MDIVALRQERAKLYEKFAAIQGKAEADGRAMTAEEEKEFESLEAQIAALDGRIKSAEKTQKLRAATAIPGPGTADPAAAGGTRVPAQAAAAEQPGVRLAQFTRSLIVGRGDLEAAASFAAQTFGESHEVTAALQSNNFQSGGALVPERFTAELIDLLRPRTVIRRNSRVMPLVGGTDTMPTVTEGTAAYYIGEGDDTQTTEPKFGNLKFVEREMAALVPISNKLLRHGSINVDLYIRDELVRSMAQTEDVNFLRGNGVGPGPKGMRYYAPAANVIAANGVVNIANIDADARKLELTLLQANIPMIDVRWIMAPRVFTYLRDLRDGNGNLVYPSLSLPNPTWKGRPTEMTNNVPVNLGGGTDSELYLADFAFAMIADSYSVRIDASETASYKTGGQLVSAFSRNQTVIRATAAHDFGMTRDEAVAVLSGVSWGA